MTEHYQATCEKEASKQLAEWIQAKYQRTLPKARSRWKISRMRLSRVLSDDALETLAFVFFVVAIGAVVLIEIILSRSSF